MADLQRTVSIIFQTDSTQAIRELDELGKSLDTVGDGTAPADVAAVGAEIDKVGKSAGVTEEQARKLGNGLKQMAADAGVPKEALSSIDSLLLRIGGPVTGSAVVAAAAVAALALVALKAGSEANEFKIKLDNLSGGARDSEKEFQFVARAVSELEVSLGDSLDLYAGYLRALDGTKISAQVAEDAFIGIGAAIKGQGGDFKDTEKALRDFVKAAADGEIDLKDLEDKIADIPGGLRIFSEALGVPIEDLKRLAENGRLGKEEIELFAAALRDEDYGSVTPVKDAFIDLWNTIKAIARDVGAGGFAEVAFGALETAIRGITLAVVGSTEFIEYLGGTLANIAFSMANLDFAGFAGRQGELWTNLESGIDGALNKLLGLKTAADEKPAGASGYQDLADSIKDVGDESGKSKPKVEKTTDAVRDSAAENKKAEAAAKALADETRRQAAAFEKAEAEVRKYQLEMEKLASNERIANIEARVSINVAQVEAETQRIEAMFESLNTSISSTGDVIDAALGSLKDVTPNTAAFDLIERQLDVENDRRKEAFDLQKKLTEAQIEEIRARTQAMQQGEGIIKIDGAGLQPHLEAFMWEILKTIQVRVNADGLSMLLGM